MEKSCIAYSHHTQKYVVPITTLILYSNKLKWLHTCDAVYVETSKATLYHHHVHTDIFNEIETSSTHSTSSNFSQSTLSFSRREEFNDLTCVAASRTRIKMTRGVFIGWRRVFVLIVCHPKIKGRKWKPTINWRLQSIEKKNWEEFCNNKRKREKYEKERKVSGVTVKQRKEWIKSTYASYTIMYRKKWSEYCWVERYRWKCPICVNVKA